MKIWIVQAQHAYVPGQPMTAHATKVSANREAASLVTIMLVDCKLAHLVGSTSRSNWKTALAACNGTRNNAERKDYDIWITELEVQS